MVAREFDSYFKLWYLAIWTLPACQPTWTSESVSRASLIHTLNFGTSARAWPQNNKKAHLCELKRRALTASANNEYLDSS